MWRRISSSRTGGQMEESFQLRMVIVCAIMFVNYDYKGITTTSSRRTGISFLILLDIQDDVLVGYADYYYGVLPW